MQGRKVIEIFDCKQGTPEWRACRMGIPTASAFHGVLAKGAGKTRKKYMLELAGEILTGKPAENFSNVHTERGHLLEDEARALHVQPFSQVHKVGFIRRKLASGHYVGCSPDSLIDTDGMMEIKTKLPHLQIETLAGGRCPPEHYAQCQGALWVTGRQWLDFVSYWPELPLFVHRVYPEPEYFATLETEVNAFCDELAVIVAAMSKLPKTPPSKALEIKNEFSSLDDNTTI
jgi:hypothetical protein